MQKWTSMLLSLLFIFLLALIPSPAYACSCESTTVEEQVQAVDAVFTGRVVSIREDLELPDTGRFVTLEVVENYKGNQTGQVVVETGFTTADCGIPFREGTQWLVYAYAGEQGMYSASSCGLTKTIDQAHSDLVALGAEEGGSSPYLLIGLLGLLGVLVWFVRRSWRRGSV